MPNDRELDDARERGHLILEILNRPEMNNPVRQSKMREVFDCLINAYILDPSRRVPERELANVVYPDRVLDPGDNNIRATVIRLRNYLDSYFRRDLSTSSLRIRIPKGEYRLEFYRRRVLLSMLPTEWFWSEYLEAEQATISVNQGTWFDPPAERKRQPNRVISAVDAFRVYKQFSELLPTPPEILREADLYWGASWGRPGLVLGLVHDPPRPLSSILGYDWPINRQVITPYEDPNGHVIFSDPEPLAGAPPVYMEDDKEVYGLVTVLGSEAHLPTRTSIIASTGEMIAKIMELLTSDDALEKVLTIDQLGGRYLHHSRPKAFQLLFSAELYTPTNEFSSSEDDPVEPRLAELCLVRVHIILPNPEPGRTPDSYPDIEEISRSDSKPMTSSSVNGTGVADEVALPRDSQPPVN